MCQNKNQRVKNSNARYGVNRVEELVTSIVNNIRCKYPEIRSNYNIQYIIYRLLASKGPITPNSTFINEKDLFNLKVHISSHNIYCDYSNRILNYAINDSFNKFIIKIKS
ncbi:unnamed protein product [Cunninghamella blakesleeana]